MTPAPFRARLLQILKITTVGIPSIPEDIKNLENVTNLQLIDGDLEKFPMAACELNELTYFRLSWNKRIDNANTVGSMWEDEKT